MVKYEVDKAHTTVGFTAKHLAVSTVRGQFNKFEGTFEGPDDDATKITGQLQIEVASVDTRTEMRETTFARPISSRPKSTPTSPTS